MKLIKMIIIIFIILLLQISFVLANENTNSRPITQISFEKLEETYFVDTLIVLDEVLDDSIAESIISKENLLNNDIRLLGIDSRTYIWDLRDQQVNKIETDSRNTGKSYPPSSIQYNDGDYTGVLSRVDVENDSYKVDKGEYVTTTESKTVNDTLTSYAYTYYDQSGNVISSYSPGNPTIQYNEDGFEGTLTKYNVILVNTSYQYYPTGVVKAEIKKFLGYYTGVVTKTRTEWVSDWHTINDYTGYYEGEVSKVIKHDFDDNFRAESDKYIIFITGDSFNSLNELETLGKITDAKIFLIASDEFQGLNYLGTNNFEDGWNHFLDILAAKYLREDKNIVLKNENFRLVKNISDEENDPITIKEKQLVHDPNFYENNSGLSENSFDTFSINNYISGLFKDEINFEKKGLYTLYQRVKDSPEKDPSLGLYSNDASVDVYVHERPVAKCEIYWQYDDAEKLYDLEFIDLSYDPDYQYGREDKGIVDKKITYISEGKQYYKFPNKLPPGEYTFHYIVKDCYNTWSTPYQIDLSLDDEPKYLGKYEVYYQHEGQTIYQESFEKILDYNSTDTMTVHARDLSPAYTLISSDSISANLTYQNPIAKIYFNYKKVEVEPTINLTIESDKMRDDNTIASGYGFKLILNIEDIETAEIVSEAVWLENKSYEWVYGHNYKINNIYPMEQVQLGRFILEENKDSANNAREIFIPVQLGDGLYSGLVNVRNIKSPNYEINDTGEVILTGYTYRTIEIPFSVEVRGTMYEDFNIVS